MGGSNQTPEAATFASNLAGVAVNYALKQGSATNCDLVTPATGAVRAKAVDLTGGTVTCTIIGTASKAGYTPATSGDISIDLSPGSQSITWGSFSGDLVVGGEAKAPGAATGTAGATITYALKQGSATNCDLVNANTGVVRARAVDLSSTQTCTIVGTATRTGYTTVTEDISIDLAPGTITVADWGSYDRVNTGQCHGGAGFGYHHSGNGR